MKITAKKRIDGKRIYIRQLQPSDAEPIYKNVRLRYYAKCIPSIPHPYTRENAANFIKGSVKAWKEKSKFDYAIVLKAKNKFIGCISISKFDHKNRIATVGYWVAKPYWRMGYGSEALSLIINFAFKYLKLHKLSATCMAYNKASASLLKKCGFSKEGHLKKHELVFGRYHDRYEFGLLREQTSIK